MISNNEQDKVTYSNRIVRSSIVRTEDEVVHLDFWVSLSTPQITAYIVVKVTYLRIGKAQGLGNFRSQ